VYLEFYEPDGSVRSWLTSEQGTVSEGSGDMTAVGNVVLVSAQGDTLRTEELYFARVPELITGPGFVRIAKPDRILTGVGFRAKPDLSEYEVEQDVRLTLIDRSGGRVLDQ
jgi:LPS export ABC transporter protein LptC